MKKLLGLAVAGVAGLAVLTGCSAGETFYKDRDDYTVVILELEDGRDLSCVSVYSDDIQGLSCDWANAK